MENNLRNLEVSCVLGNFSDFHDVIDFDSTNIYHTLLKSLTNSIINFQYTSILQTDLSDYKIILSAKGDNTSWESYSFSFKNRVSTDITQNCELLQNLIFTFLGVASLQEFVRLNFCGPVGKVTEEFEKFCSVLGELDENKTFELLSMQGEYIPRHIRNPELLLMSLVLLRTSVGQSGLTQKWWLLRCLMVYQNLLPEEMSSLYKEMKKLIQEILTSAMISKYLAADLLFRIECAIFHLHYHEVGEAQVFINYVQTLIGLNVKLGGALGKRTRYQQKEVAQLLVNLQRNNSELYQKVPSFVNDTSTYPKNLQLQDDTLLNDIAFNESTFSERNSLENIFPEEQLVLLAVIMLMQRSNPSGSDDDLVTEELMSYISCLLQKPLVWSIYTKGLILRSRCEKKSSRKIDRSLRQLEEVIGSIKSESTSFSMRQYMFYATNFPTMWHLEKELADLLMKCACTRSALSIYERLGSWDDIVHCYQMLGMKSSAKELIEQKIHLSGETPLLLCLMGDVTEDIEFYHKAITLSNGGNARSHRSLAYYYYQRKDYESSIPHFEKTLEINHLQPSVWFSLAIAATECAMFDLASKAYRQMLNQDNDSFEAWNNLAAVYIKTNQKPRAWNCLQEALKLNYEDWKLWENFLLISTDIGAFDDIVRAYHRLMDLKQKHLDVKILEILVKAITEDIKDFHGTPSRRLLKRVQELFGRITATITSEPALWELYSKLQINEDVEEKENSEKAVRFQQKALHCALKTLNWTSEFESFKRTLNIALGYGGLSVNYIKSISSCSQKTQQKTISKISLQNVVTISRKSICQFKGDEYQELHKLLEAVESKVNDIVAL